MNNRASEPTEITAVFDDLEAPVNEFFAPRPRPGRPRRETPAPTVRPEHYKVVSISLYTADIERLDDLVKQLKAKGQTRANKSLVIREALRQLDLSRIPPQR